MFLKFDSIKKHAGGTFVICVHSDAGNDTPFKGTIKMDRKYDYFYARLESEYFTVYFETIDGIDNFGEIQRRVTLNGHYNTDVAELIKEARIIDDIETEVRELYTDLGENWLNKLVSHAE
jgi:hypothetical protein